MQHAWLSAANTSSLALDQRKRRKRPRQTKRWAQVPIEASGQKVYIPCDALVTQKPKGASTVFTILREGKTEQHSVVMAPIPPLMPRFHGVDGCDAEYILFGGFVFTRATVPLRKDYSEASRGGGMYRGPHMSKVIGKGLRLYKQSAEQEVVLLMRESRHSYRMWVAFLSRWQRDRC